MAADPKQWTGFSPHITKVVKYGIQGIHFPCKAKFRRVNATLDGAEEAGAIFDPWYNAIYPTDPEEKKKACELRGVQKEQEDREEGAIWPQRPKTAAPQWRYERGS